MEAYGCDVALGTYINHVDCLDMLSERKHPGTADANGNGKPDIRGFEPDFPIEDQHTPCASWDVALAAGKLPGISMDFMCDHQLKLLKPNSAKEHSRYPRRQA